MALKSHGFLGLSLVLVLFGGDVLCSQFQYIQGNAGVHRYSIYGTRVLLCTRGTSTRIYRTVSRDIETSRLCIIIIYEALRAKISYRAQQEEKNHLL